MASKRNKLLVFLGLISVAVSKSHNQRFIFEHEFESRRSSAREPSANIRHIEDRSDLLMPLEELLPTAPTGNFRQVKSSSDNEYNVQQETKELPVIHSYKSEHSFYTPHHIDASVQSMVEDIIYADSSDLDFKIEPEKYYFEAKKLSPQNQKVPTKKSEDRSNQFYIRRSGEVAAETNGPTKKNESNTSDRNERNKENIPKLITPATQEVNKTAEHSEKAPKSSKRGKKRIKGKRKKVVRVRARQQSNNKTRENDEKVGQTPLHKQKLLIVDTSANDDPRVFKEPKTSKTDQGFKQQTETASKSSEPSQKRQTDWAETTSKPTDQDHKWQTDAKVETTKPPNQIHEWRSDRIETSSKPTKKGHNWGTETSKTPNQGDKQQEDWKVTASKPKKQDYKRQTDWIETSKSAKQGHKWQTDWIETTKPPKQSHKKQSTRVEIASKTPTTISQVVDVEPNTGKIIKSKKAREENDPEIVKEADQDHILTFFRRQGDKVTTVLTGDQDYPEPEWVSMYKTEDRNKDGNYYVLSFNYMGKKNLQAKNAERSAPRKSSRKSKQLSEDTAHKTEHPTAELDISYLEKTAGHFLENKKETAVFDSDKKKAHHHPNREGNLKYSNHKAQDEEKYHFPKHVEYEDSWVANKDHVEKYLTPTVTLKRKKSRKNQEAVWKMQEPRKKFPNEKPRPSVFEKDNSYSNSEEIEKPSTGYFLKSFLKLPSGEDLALNLRDDEMTLEEDRRDLDSSFKDMLQNPRDQDYFVRMYKTLGDVEDFDFQSGEDRSRFVHPSSPKTKWANDDTHGRVHDTLKQSSYEHPFPLENTGSFEDFPAESSENVMQYKERYIDDFNLPLNEGRSYYADSVPIYHRYRRSVNQEPRIVPHFKLGDADVESNHSLEHTPRFQSKRLRKTSNDKQTLGVHSSLETRSKNSGIQTDITVNKPMKSNVKSYYPKPVGKNEKTQSRDAFKAYKTDAVNIKKQLEDGSQKSVNTTRNKQIIHSYDIPKKESGQMHDITFFHDSKNSKIDMKIIAKGKPTGVPALHVTPSSKKSDSVSFINFGGPSHGMMSQLQSSTDTKSTYVDPNEEEKTNIIASETTVVILDATGSTPPTQENQFVTTEKPTTELPSYAQFYDRMVELQTDDQVFFRKPIGLGVQEQNSDRTTTNHVLNEITTNPTTEYTTIRFPSKVRSTKKNRMSKSSQIKKIVGRLAKPTYQETTEETTMIPTTEQRPAVTLFSPRLRPSRASLPPPTKSSLKRTFKQLTTTIPPVIQDRMDETTISTTTKRQSSETTRGTNRADNTVTVHYTNTNPNSETIQDRPTSVPKTTRSTQFFRRTVKSDNIGLVPETLPSVKPRVDDYKDWGYASDESDNSESGDLQQEVGDHLRKNSDWTRHSHFDSEDSSEEFGTDSGEKDAISNAISPEVPFQWGEGLQSKTERKHPMHHKIPKTDFTCKGRAPGYYADPDTECQVFHMCHGAGVKHSFLCPNTTIFNQELLVCDWHSKVNCRKSESFYSVNNNIYKHPSAEETKPWKQWNYKHEKTTGRTYPEPVTENHLQGKQDDKELPHIPRFIVDRLKNEVPNAEIGRPRSVSKSYRTVVSKPKNTVSFPTPNHPKEDTSEIPPKFLTNTEEKLIPESFLRKQKAIKDSWTFQDVEKALSEQLQADPAMDKSLNGRYISYSFYPQHDKPQYHYSGDENSQDSASNENGYGTFSIIGHEHFKNGDSHVAGRQNEKLIVVNRNRLRPGYESAEAPESETTIKEESLSKVQFPEAGARTGGGYKNYGPYPKNPEHGYLYKDFLDKIKSKNENPEYSHSEIKALENDDGQRGHHVIHAERPKMTNSHNIKIIQLKQPHGVSGYDGRDHVDLDPQAKKIKLRIKEIKSGIDNIGSQLGGILGGTDTDFKNIKVYKLKPYGSHEEFREIKLPPFKFEKNHKAPHTVREEKQTILKGPLYTDKNFIPLPRHSVNFELVPQKERNFKDAKNRDTAHSKHKNKKLDTTDHVKTFATIPKLVRQVDKNVPITFRSSAKHVQPTNRQNVPDKKFSSDLRTKLTDQTIRGQTPYQSSKAGQTRTTKLSETKISTSQDEAWKIYPPAANTHNDAFGINDDEYKVKYIPLIRLNKPTKAYLNRKGHRKHIQTKHAPEYVSEHSFEHMEHIPSSELPEGRSVMFFPGEEKMRDSNFKLDKQNGTNSADAKEGTRNDKIGASHLNKFKTDQDEKLITMTTTKSPSKFPHPTVKIRKSSGQKKDKRTFIVISKPNRMKDPYSKAQTDFKEKYENGYKMVKESPIKLEQMKKITSDCDESTSDESSFQSMTLGKNGPQHDLVKINRSKDHLELKISENARPHYGANQDISPKCRNQGIKSTKNHQNTLQDQQPLDYSKDATFPPQPPASAQGLHRHGLPRIPSKMAHTKAVITPRPQLHKPNEKLVKLFDFQRNSRPAFTNPFTTPRTILNLIDEYPKATDYALDVSDRRSDESSKEMVGRQSNLASLEHEAELKMKQNSDGQVKFSAARKSPQGKVAPEDPVKESRYAELEREAELKAERMISTKSRSPNPTSKY